MTADRDARNAARWKIIQAANNEARKRANRSRVSRPLPRLLGMKQIQQAVCRARRRDLVPDHVLTAAGYNPRRKT